MLTLSATAQRTAATAARWLGEGRRVVGAVLVDVEGSAPLDPGATMLIAEGGEIEGSITGGCVEGAVVEEANRILAGGAAKLLTYGISDELAGEVGLTCGGTFRIFVHELSGPSAEVVREALEAALAGTPVAICTPLEGDCAGFKLALVGGRRLGMIEGKLGDAITRDAAAMLTQGRSGVRRYGRDGARLGAELAVHVHCFAPPPQMLIFGAIDFSAALARAASGLGYAVTICDPREPFLRSARFSDYAEVEVAWPEEALARRTLGPRDAVLVFSHDPKLDEPALRGALRTEAGYVGALGSRRTTVDRYRRLLADGVDEELLERVHAPCGLDVGGGTPEEVAISVLAEILADRSGRPGTRLREGIAAIHPRETQEL
jgi:xanthine dehydrogenase accessory factor